MSKQEKLSVLASQGFKRKFILWYWLFFKLNSFEGIKTLYFIKGIDAKKLVKLEPSSKYILNGKKLLLEVDEQIWIKELVI